MRKEPATPLKCPFCNEELKSSISQCGLCGWRENTPFELLKKEIPTTVDFKVLVFGDPDVGKKTFIDRYTRRFSKSDAQSDLVRTLGIDFAVSSMLIDRYRIRLKIWHIGNIERTRILLPAYVKGANGVLFMYDISNYSSLIHIDDWIWSIRKEIGSENVYPTIVVGNKADLLDAREVSSEEGINIAKSNGTDGFVECSSKTGENVEETFASLARIMMVRSGFIF